MNIDASMIEQFERDGVLLLRNALDADQLKACEKAWEWSLANPSPNASGFPPEKENTFTDATNPNVLDGYRSVVSDGPLGSYAQQIWGGSPVWFMYEQVFLKGEINTPVTHWHQDTSYWSINGSQMIAFWISFDSVSQEDALQFVKGSSRQTLFGPTMPLPDDPTNPLIELPLTHPGYLPGMPDIAKNPENYDITSFATEPGDIVAFHTSTLHGGAGTSETTPKRRTVTLRFFGEDCRKVHAPLAGPHPEHIENLAIGERVSNAPCFLKVRDAA